MSATAVLNAQARRLRRPVFAARVSNALQTALPNPTVLRPACAESARALIARDTAPLLVVAGGDGAVNLALNARCDDSPRLGIIPGGTANDLARALNLPLDPEGAAARLTAPARPVDVLTVNGRRFLTTGGIGLPALVARVANRVKRRGGRVVRIFGDRVYAGVAATQILGRRCLGRPMRIGWTCPTTGQHHERSLRAYGALVTNVGAVAGRMQLCSSTVDDGVFEICLLPARGRLRLLDTLLRLSRGKGVSARRMPVIRTRQAWIEAAPGVFFGDGETLAEGRRFEIGLQPHGVRIAGALKA